MSNELAISNSLPELAADINVAHDQAAQALRDGIHHAIRAGELLLKAKAQLSHGKWLPWLQANCEIPERTAQAYMRLACLPVEKRNAVADLPLRDALSAIRSQRKSRRVTHPARSEVITIEEDLEADEYRGAFLLRAADALA